MLFSSMTFLLIFLPIVFVLSLIIGKKYQNLFLVIASLLFYAWGEPIYVLLMIVSILINYCIGLLIDRHATKKRLFLCIGLVSNICILGYFKYFDFLVENMNQLLGRQMFSAYELPLPIGISFFTFQSISYIVDLYRGHYKAQQNIINMALYITLFPQLIAGPIVRYEDICSQIESREVTIESISSGIRRFAYGLGKKVLLANVLASYVDKVLVQSIDCICSRDAWLVAILYTFQIYYDFSGYSDMALGLGRMFGFDFPENFNYPYLSSSIREFWQRWHISLGTWFRQYVYIPLGGNKKGFVRTLINVMIVFLLTGFWHGANWTFVLWGAYHGFFQVVERLGFDKLLKKTHILNRLYTWLVFIIGWVIFRSDNCLIAIRLIAKMLYPFDNSNMPNILPFSLHICTILALAIIGCGIIQSILKRHEKISQRLHGGFLELLFCSIIVILSFSALASDTYNPFIYFRF